MIQYPRITIITPSFNQAQYLEQTIQSVLDQNYPNLEYMIVDGGSTDGSKEIIEKYSDQLHWWCSTKDNGQAHALNKGLDKATGDVIAYINSDDWYLPGVLHNVGEYFREHPTTDFLYGRCQFVDEQGKLLKTHSGNIFTLEELLDLWNVWWKERQFVQPECFWSRRIFLKVRSFREDYINTFDYEYWTRLFLANAKIDRLNVDVCCFRFHANQKSNDSELAAREELEIVKSILWNRKSPVDGSVRMRLQADWIYSSHFMKTVEKSVASGEPRWQRQMRLALLILKYPKILFSEQLHQRIKQLREERSS